MKLRVEEKIEIEAFDLIMFAPGRSFHIAVSINKNTFIRDPPGTITNALVCMKGELKRQNLLLTDNAHRDDRSYRVIERVSKGSEANWEPLTDTELWFGTDPRQYTGKYGQIGGAFMRKTENVLQILMTGDHGESQWEDVDHKTAISRFKSRPRGQGYNSPRQQSDLYEENRYGPGPDPRGPPPPRQDAQLNPDILSALRGLNTAQTQSPTERAAERRTQAQQNQRAKAEKLRGNQSAAAAHMARTRGEVEDEQKAKLVEEKAERERRAQEAADKRDAQVRRMARASFNGLSEISGQAEIAWAEAATKEAAARDEQVEDELFGGGGEGIMTSVIWSGAEQAAMKLLEFAQARVDEARARKEGKGAAMIEEEVDEDALERAAINEGAQEHVSESEFREAEGERVKHELTKNQNMGAPDVGDAPDVAGGVLGGLLSDEEQDALVELMTKATG